MTSNDGDFGILAALVIGVLVIMFMASCPTDAHADSVKGSVTYINGQGRHYAATHHGDHQPTFVDGAVLRLERKRHHFIVKVSDTCAGSTCRMLDVSPSAFKALHVSTSKGVMRVKVECGRKGNKPMRKCLAGENS